VLRHLEARRQVARSRANQGFEGYYLYFLQSQVQNRHRDSKGILTDMMLIVKMPVWFDI